MLLLAIWFLAFVVRQVCDRLLQLSFGWLLGTIQRRAVAKEEGFGADDYQNAKKSFLERGSGRASGSSEMDEDEDLWLEYFADPTQWWDNRAKKRNPRAPDFKHRVSKKALWIDGWYTPRWARERFQ